MTSGGNRAHTELFARKLNEHMKPQKRKKIQKNSGALPIENFFFENTLKR